MDFQDQVPPFESEIALKIVEEELGAAIGQIFEQFDPDPIAAASLGITCLQFKTFIAISIHGYVLI